MNFTATFLVTAVVVLSFMICAYFASTAKEDNGIADISWGVGFIIAAFTSLSLNNALNSRKILVSTLVFFWGMRLASYIWLRRHRAEENPRFREFLAQSGKHPSLKSFLRVFIFQGFLLLVVAFPVIYINTYGGPAMTILDWGGTMMWVVGFLMESIADFQLFAFRKNEYNRGNVLTTGLWKYSRHPNYFGESLMWWGIFTIALSVPGAYATAIGPLLLTFLLLRVSGIPVLERRYAGDSRYREYQQTTSAFIPWFPTHSSHQEDFGLPA